MQISEMKYNVLCGPPVLPTESGSDFFKSAYSCLPFSHREEANDVSEKCSLMSDDALLVVKRHDRHCRRHHVGRCYV